MTYDDFNIELGTVLYLDRIDQAAELAIKSGKMPADDVRNEFETTRQRVMREFLTFASLPADATSVTNALANVTKGMSDGERTALLTIRNIQQRQQSGIVNDDDDEALADAVEAAEAYLMNRLADILEENE